MVTYALPLLVLKFAFVFLSVVLGAAKRLARNKESPFSRYCEAGDAGYVLLGAWREVVTAREVSTDLVTAWGLEAEIFVG